MAGRVPLVKAACEEPRNLAKGTAMTSGQDDRKERLAQALRDNLRRRKAQARAGVGESAPDRKDEKKPD